MADNLKRNILGTNRLVWQGWGMTAPAADIAYLLGGIALVALGATPLSILVGFLIYLTILNTSYRFSSKYVSAGSDFTYVGKSIGGFMATFEGWNLLFGTIFAYAGFGMLGLAGFFGIFDSKILTGGLWIPIVLALNVITFIILYKGIRFSTNYQIITGIAEFIILIAGGIGLVILAGKNNTLAVFSPFIASGGIIGFAHSLTLSVVTFIGLSIALTAISEEAHIPKKTVPKSLLISSIIIGVTIVFLSYAMTVAWGPSRMLSFGNSVDNGLVLFREVSPIMFGLLFIFTVNSFMGNNISMGTSMTRIFYAFSRDNIIFPGIFSRTDKNGTPVYTTIFILVISVFLCMVFGIYFGPIDGGYVLLFADAFFSFLIRSISSSSLIISTFKAGKINKKTLTGYLIAPVISIVALIAVLASNFFPLPAYPYNFASVLGIVIIVVVLAITLITWIKRPDTVKNAGSTTVEETPADAVD
ncbi:APC family permease [Ferroplasma acidiphilum]|uniref:APC family permease n=1 Tax=Ferroplasma acidiphilum TaxID=74969 RepID=UPI0023F15962|nr:APC family permease [Ferroplasma acidiphilum]